MKTKLAYIFYLFTVCMISSSCNIMSKESDPILIVSIAPLKYIVENITCGDFFVEVLVPEGSNPETYSPTPEQLIKTERASAIFITGLIDFENELISKMRKSLTNTNISTLSSGVNLNKGACLHSSANKTNHSHGIDPHIWTSPKQLRIMTDNAYETIREIFPDSIKYHAAYLNLINEIDVVSKTVENKINQFRPDFFIIYHPAFTYYSIDYGVPQISLEHEGKEPSAAYFKEIIEKIRENNNIRYVIYQEEFPSHYVEIFAKDAGVTPIGINPLAEDILTEIINFTDIICNNVN